MENKLDIKREKIVLAVERGKVAFKKFSDFIKKMRSKYSVVDFPDERTVNQLDPDNEINASMEHESLVIYDALLGNQTAGIIIGEDKGETLKGSWYIIDPEYQNSDVGKELIKAVTQDFKRVTLLASVQGEPNIPSDDPNYLNTLIKKKSSRQQALIRYYQRLGFKPDINSELYRYHKQPHDPMPMVIE